MKLANKLPCMDLDSFNADRARPLAVSAPRSSDWLYACPMSFVALGRIKKMFALQLAFA